MRAAILVGALLVGLAACGGDDSDTSDEATADVTTTAASDEVTTTTVAAAPDTEPAGGDFCAQVKGVLELSKSLGLGAGSVPGADALQQIRDAQGAIDPPDEIEAESATGRATLYVVLTRATQLLTTLG